jgi:hypothetical protein
VGEEDREVEGRVGSVLEEEEEEEEEEAEAQTDRDQEAEKKRPRATLVTPSFGMRDLRCWWYCFLRERESARVCE